MRVIGLEPGTRVQHRGTKQWGTVLRAKPQRDGTYEYRVQRDEPLYPGGSNDPTWWASYALCDVRKPCHG